MGLFDKLLGRNIGGKPAKSSTVAKDRLQLALISDRIKVTPEQMELIKEEIVSVISRHFDIDREAMEITWGDKHDKLVANIPVRRSRML
ncbi:MAG: cell division topological specificity factor MinE [Chloroflexi bacterium]|uniref:Cell division topological specificity factor n=1 Tax=Candidatus Chlorohelix allophototropha TaxID=3003348 RepID=A0A8T7M9Y6_9CHLR|nr:cell division topological specificity factor MinE [Chloroflexota bacterium]WJW68889.1 cell division topological specificity factor MinE [Chloroflexota bacterium L227-S17]